MDWSQGEVTLRKNGFYELWRCWPRIFFLQKLKFTTLLCVREIRSLLMSKKLESINLKRDRNYSFLYFYLLLSLELRLCLLTFFFCFVFALRVSKLYVGNTSDDIQMRILWKVLFFKLKKWNWSDNFLNLCNREVNFYKKLNSDFLNITDISLRTLKHAGCQHS